ncbi:carbohydrate ABC transporter permease [Mycoplasma sp. Ms02]|uniref:carbohydrate ABC transporter permease n=1 Tax=Mycoplasma sp. Ms02 TaxID=353851 RepID=UPI001C8A086D|nr:carbohydrate ABC transporter permease [Mycoplasma sp. Ms02]QZE12122.1 carbohydrate ABC transporter permease [Mycoplasma sp. Ms02]
MNKNIMWQKALGKSIVYIGILLFALLWIMPFILLGNTSAKDFGEANDPTEFLKIAKSFHVSNYTEAYETMDTSTAFFVTLAITIVSNISIIFVSSLAAWQLARSKKLYAKIIFYGFIIALIIPFQSIMFTLFKLVENLHLLNFLGMVILYTGFGLALSTFMMHGFISSIPTSLEEVAKVEGYGPLRTYFKIVLPLLKPIITTIVILNTMWIWNDFLLPYLFTIKNPEAPSTLIVNLYSKVSQFVSNPAVQTAALVIVVLPVLVFFVIAQKNIISGITSGSVK